MGRFSYNGGDQTLCSCSHRRLGTRSQLLYNMASVRAPLVCSRPSRILPPLLSWASTPERRILQTQQISILTVLFVPTYHFLLHPPPSPTYNVPRSPHRRLFPFLFPFHHVHRPRLPSFSCHPASGALSTFSSSCCFFFLPLRCHNFHLPDELSTARGARPIQQHGQQRLPDPSPTLSGRQKAKSWNGRGWNALVWKKTSSASRSDPLGTCSWMTCNSQILSH